MRAKKPHSKVWSSGFFGGGYGVLRFEFGRKCARFSAKYKKMFNILNMICKQSAQHKKKSNLIFKKNSREHSADAVKQH